MLQVDNVLYRLHKSLLCLRSKIMADMFGLPQAVASENGSFNGQDDNHPVTLTNCTAREFEYLCDYLFVVYV